MAGRTPKGSPGDPEGTRRRRARVSRWRDPEQKPRGSGGSSRRLSFPLGDPEWKPGGSGAPCLPPRLGFSRGDPRNGSSGVPGALSLPVPRFPARVVPKGTPEDLGRPAVPCPCFSWRTRNGILAGSAAPPARAQTWRVGARGGPGAGVPLLPPPNFFHPGLQAASPPFPSISPPKVLRRESRKHSCRAKEGRRGGSVGGPRRVHHSLSAPEPATVFILMEPLPAQPHLSPQGCL